MLLYCKRVIWLLIVCDESRTFGIMFRCVWRFFEWPFLPVVGIEHFNFTWPPFPEYLRIQERYFLIHIWASEAETSGTSVERNNADCDTYDTVLQTQITFADRFCPIPYYSDCWIRHTLIPGTVSSPGASIDLGHVLARPSGGRHNVTVYSRRQGHARAPSRASARLP